MSFGGLEQSHVALALATEVHSEHVGGRSDCINASHPPAKNSSCLRQTSSLKFHNLATVPYTKTMADTNTHRKPVRFITGHDSNGKGVVEVVDEGLWTKIDNDMMRYNVMWTTSTFPIDIKNDDASLQKEKTVLSLSLPNGIVLRMVDRSPGSSSAMHRTQSLDYGVVIEGEMEMIMDSGQVVTLKRGDVCVQRGTLHQWRNSTKTWNRMLFVLMDALPLEVGGKSSAARRATSMSRRLDLDLTYEVVSVALRIQVLQRLV
jgi:quercetin dioxygenase-like cupin family protein